MILGGHLGGNTGLREMGTQGWPGFVSFGFVNNIETCSFCIISTFSIVEWLDEILLVHCRLWCSFTCTTLIVLEMFEQNLDGSPIFGSGSVEHNTLTDSSIEHTLANRLTA